MNKYYRTFLIVAFTLGMANASLSEDECVTLKCSDMQGSTTNSPDVSGKDLTFTICPTQKIWFQWDNRKLAKLESVSDSEYTLRRYVSPHDNRNGHQTTIDRVSGGYTYYSSRGSDSITVSGNCSKVALKPIPEDADKPKF